MAIIDQLKQDYARFPVEQTYSLYAESVRFKDPMTSFTGLDRYREMIGFLAKFFSDIQMDLHDISQAEPRLITTEWTLHMTPPLPWSPRLSIPGRSELRLDANGLINAHVDYWHCSKWAVLKQVFGR
jgi:hypothetical protein